MSKEDIASDGEQPASSTPVSRHPRTMKVFKTRFTRPRLVFVDEAAQEVAGWIMFGGDGGT